MSRAFCSRPASMGTAALRASRRAPWLSDDVSRSATAVEEEGILVCPTPFPLPREGESVFTGGLRPQTPLGGREHTQAPLRTKGTPSGRQAEAPRGAGFPTRCPLPREGALHSFGAKR